MTPPPESSASFRTPRTAGPEQNATDVAFSRLVDRHAGRCLSAARQVLRDEQLAQQAVQDAYLDLWRRASRVDALPAPLGPWLVMVTHRRAVDRVRAGQARPEPTEAFPELFSDEHEAHRSLLGEQTVALLRQLPEEQRRCLVLAYWGGYTMTEIGAMLDIPAATVAARCRLALQCLSLLVQQGRPGPRVEGPTGGRA